MSVQDVPVDTIRVDDWETARNLAVRIGGPNPSFSPISPYSEAHFKGVGGWLENLDRYDVVFVDSVTAISRLSFRWAEQQPEARSERTGAKDLRSVYGTHGRELLMWLHQLQHARGKHVVFVGILEKSPTISVVSSSIGCRWRARRCRARSAPSSIYTSRWSGSVSTITSRCAHSFARRRIHTDTPQRIAVESDRHRRHSPALATIALCRSRRRHRPGGLVSGKRCRAPDIRAQPGR